MTFAKLIESLPEYDLWQYLQTTDKPIVMYGMGNGADKIITVLDSIGASVSDFFASDGFVRGQSFHEKKVLSFSEIKEKYTDFIILVSFGSEREEVINTISELSSQYELYLPDVPVAGDGIFDRKFFDNNHADIEKAYELLADDASRDTFCDIIMYKLTGKIDYLLKHTADDREVYTSLFDMQNRHRTVDLGAYNGDSVAFLAELAPSVSEIIALEPDRKNYVKLLRNTEALAPKVEAYNICAWSEKTTLYFDRGGNRNSSVSSIGHTASVGDTVNTAVYADTVDNILNGRRVDFIKYDVEGSELEALRGSEITLKNSNPDILMSGYHRNEDLFALTLKLHELLPSHKLYIRRKRCLPAWEISICAVSENK